MIREHFDREGWAMVPRFLTPRDVEALRAATDELALKGASLSADSEIDGARYEVQSARGRRGEAAIRRGALRKITFASSASPQVALLRNDRRVLKLIESVGVSSPRWIVDQINLKEPGVGTGFPWHQDVAFVAWQQRDAIAKYGGANLVIALLECEVADRACSRVKHDLCVHAFDSKLSLTDGKQPSRALAGGHDRRALRVEDG